MFVSVVIQNSTREYDRFYDYRVPESLEAYMQPGIRVLVPFSRGEGIREGFVMEVKAESAFRELKEICQVIDETPVLTPELIQLCQLMKKRYICTYDLALRCMIPSGLGLMYRREVLLKYQDKNTPEEEKIREKEKTEAKINTEGSDQSEAKINADGSDQSEEKIKAEGNDKAEDKKNAEDSDKAEDRVNAESRESAEDIEKACDNEKAGEGDNTGENENPRQGESICKAESTQVYDDGQAAQIRPVYGAEEQQLLDILKQQKGSIFIDQLQEILKKPVLKLLRKLEERGLIEIVNHYQLKARAKTVRVALPALEMDEYQDLVSNNRIRNMNHLRLMEMLYEEGQIPVHELNVLGFSSAVLNNLKKKGYITFSEELLERNPLETEEAVKTEPLNPTPCQMKALDAIFAVLSQNTFGEILLHGVTGSGKTEVYLQVIQEVINQGKTAIMLVPEIGLTPQTVRQFKGRFGDGVAVLHSRLSMGERFDQWNRIKDGKVRVVVGARSAVFAPLSNLGVIIIDEEHESSYKSDRTPKYDARTIAAARCRLNNGLLLYGSATPSVENYWRAVNGKIKLVEMLERTNSKPLPEVITVDMRVERENGLRNELSEPLVVQLQKNKAAGEQAILFINRRGHSNFMLCGKCGYIAVCPYCSVSLTWHQAEKRLVCHYCGYATTKPAQCPVCKDGNIDPYGIGTQKVEEMLPVLEPGFSVIRMDFDTTGGRMGHQKILDAFREQKIDVMVGTQMIAKGHDFPNVTLVGILCADSLLGSGDYRAAERTFQLITQASGRAGRAEKAGRVVLQTYNPDEFCIQAAIRQDYKAFFRQEISLRRELQLPPFYQFAVIQLSGKDNKTVQAMARKIYSEIQRRQEFNQGLFLSEPSPSPVAKIKNRYRWRIVLKHPSVKTLGTVLEWVFDTYAGSGKSDYSISVDINPASML